MLEAVGPKTKTSEAMMNPELNCLLDSILDQCL